MRTTRTSQAGAHGRALLLLALELLRDLLETSARAAVLRRPASLLLEARVGDALRTQNIFGGASADEAEQPLRNAPRWLPSNGVRYCPPVVAHPQGLVIRHVIDPGRRLECGDGGSRAIVDVD